MIIVFTVNTDDIIHVLLIVVNSNGNRQNSVYDKPVGDWISVPSPDFVAVATRVGPTTFCMVPLNWPSPKTPC